MNKSCLTWRIHLTQMYKSCLMRCIRHVLTNQTWLLHLMRDTKQLVLLYLSGMPRHTFTCGVTWLIHIWCDTTHSYIVWHDSFIYGVTWLIHIWCDMTHSYMVWHDSDRATSAHRKDGLVHMLCHDVFIWCDTAQINQLVTGDNMDWFMCCDMTDSYGVTWPIYLVWHDLFIYGGIWSRLSGWCLGKIWTYVYAVAWLIHMRWHDLYIYDSYGV